MNALKPIYTLFLVLLVSCTVTKRVKDGDTAYQLKQYAIAVGMLEDEYANTQDREVQARKAYYLGKSYDILQNYGEAVQWFELAKKHRYPAYMHIVLGNAYMKNEQYKQASELFLKRCHETFENEWCIKSQLCDAAIKQKAKPSSTQISPFSVNSKYGEYSPVFFEEDYLVFTSDREGSIGDDTYNWTGNAFSDLYVANLQGRKVNNFDAIINSAANEGAACFSQDFNEIYFTRCESIELRDYHCRIYYSQRPNGFWMEPEPLMFFNEETNFGQPCLIEGDSVLIYSAAPVSGDGTYDLYYSERIDGGWSSPELMPSSINTQGNERFPTSYKDTLYFSSDYLPGYGGDDIFKTYLKNDTWSKPVNMGLPINSGADDFGLAIDPNRSRSPEIISQGYLSSSRNVGTGDDLFFFTEYKSKEAEEEKEPEPTEDTAYKIYLACRSVELLHEEGDPNKKLIGKKPLSEVVVKLNDSKNFKTDAKGFFVEEINEGANYALTASHDDYLVTQKKVSTYFSKALTKDTTINVELALEKIVYDREITLDNIYYDYNRADIRKDAQPTLDSLKQMLELNPTMRIQLSSHTDCRGELEFNKDLSQRRAQSAVNYLKSLGVAEERLSAVGYGEISPAVNCNCDDCTESEHQTNRRTTFKILR